jgi:transglutaminase-like putative cysteine protease
MPLLRINHLTEYAYDRPVSFGEHRIMMRPREGFDQRLVETRLDIQPEPSALHWIHDVFGNAVAVARFDTSAQRLSVRSETLLEHSPLARAEVSIEPYARLFPFTYSAEDMPDLLRSIERHHLDPERRLDDWARNFVKRDGSTATFDLLSQMALSIKRDFTYVGRQEKGTQTPVETLSLRQGSCRDFAMLMIEAARALGFAARFVSGYVYDPSGCEGIVGGGNTHAWVRIFLPGSGWVEFDPTNGIIGSHGLIRVAVARDPYQALPLWGTWTGFPRSFLGMTLDVDIRLAEAHQFSSHSNRIA